MALTAQDFDNAEEDLITISDVTNNDPGVATSRLGQVIQTLSLAIQSLGFDGVVAWTTSTLFDDFKILVTEGGSTYNLQEVHTSGVFATDLANGKWILYNPEGLGTAAFENVQTSSTDTTVGALMGVGAFGLGVDDSIELTAANDLDDVTVSGFYHWGSSVPTNAPGGFTFCTMIINGQSANPSQLIQRRASSDASVKSFLRTKSSGVWAEVEIYHTGNLNQFEFGAGGSGDRVPLGVAISTSAVIFELPVSLFQQAAGVTVVGTFSVKYVDGSAVTGGAGIIPVYSTVTSWKSVYVSVSGLSGITRDDPVYLSADSSASKITVNP